MLPLLLHVSVGLALLAPFAAGHVVLLIESGQGARLQSWFGLTVGLLLLTALPLTALAVGMYGPAHWSPYRFALVIAASSPVLGLLLLRAHARRLRGDPEPGERLPFACLGFAAALGLFLVPWILGVPIPLPAADGQPAITGGARAYAAFVLPASLALSAEAWLLAATPDRRTGGRGWLLVATGGLAFLLAFSLAVLPVWNRNPGRAAALERDRLREHAADLDLPRRQTFADLAAGRVPALTTEPCRSVPEAWLSRARFGTRPKDRTSLVEAADAWKGLESVNVWLPGATDRARAHGRALGLPIDRGLDGPLRRRVYAALDERAFPSPWTRQDAWLPADEARRRVESRAHAAPWHADGTLIVTRETPSFASYGESSLGMVEASLWLWSYDDRALLCGGRAQVPPGTLGDTFGDAQATVVRDALRMRALALAVADLRAVAPPP